VAVFKLGNGKGGRNKRFLWKCKDCRKQYTVRIGTVYEESRIPLRHWCYAFLAMSESKKGVSALRIMRHCQISYKSSLFLLHRIRHAMAPAADALKLTGVCELDETYIGGKPRYKGINRRGRGTNKQPVFAVVQRGGRVRTRVAANVTADTLKDAVHEFVDRSAKIVTDELPVYGVIARRFRFVGGHEKVEHGAKEYVSGDVHTNTIEGFFAILKRGLSGIYHNVSKEHLHRYMSEFEFRYNARSMNDGDRTVAAIKSAEGKRLMYRAPKAQPTTPEAVTVTATEPVVWKESLFE
jgi:transposase-like protein